MAIAENIPYYPSMPPATGDILRGESLRQRSYRLRNDNHRAFDVHSILAARGIFDPEVFLKPKIARDFPDVERLIDIDRAADRIAHAVMNQERVLIFGDYDVDGASSSAILGRWFRSMGLKVDIYIPDRFLDGYGPSEGALLKAGANAHDLTIFVDCGTASASLLNDLGCDAIVIDHHMQQGLLPTVVAVVNPHRHGDTSGLKMLCAAALCFLVVRAAQTALVAKKYFSREDAPSLMPLLELVALASVADVVPLTGPSRLFTAKGIDVMRRMPSKSIAALMKVSGVTDISASKIGFTIGPRINAGGRIGGGSNEEDGGLGVRLLMSEDPEEILDIAAKLDAMNANRQSIEKSCLEEAMERASLQAAMGVSVVMLVADDWHPGVVGIVAGRIKERFDLPAIVAARSGDLFKGSGRSIAGFDLGSIVLAAREKGLLQSGGGHAVACGISCLPERWEELCEFMQGRDRPIMAPIEIDALVDIADVSFDAIESMEALQPLGQGMPSVRIAVGGFQVDRARNFGNGHIRFECGGNIEAIAWRAADDGLFTTDLEGKCVTIIGSARINEWNDRRKVQIDIQDIVR